MKTFFAIILLNLLVFAGIYHRSLAEYYELKYHTQLPSAGENLRALDLLRADALLCAISQQFCKQPPGGGMGFRGKISSFANAAGDGGANGGGDANGAGGANGGANGGGAANLNTAPQNFANFQNAQNPANPASWSQNPAHSQNSASWSQNSASRARYFAAKTPSRSALISAISSASNGALMACAQPIWPNVQRLSVGAAGVILIGDSLMQGLAQRLCRHLRERGAPCVNLAKQSSGLLHTRFYDYASVLREELARRPGARVIVLAGVNDLFDAHHHGKKIAFGTDEFEQLYAQKLARLSAADAFIALPALREDKGAERARWFNATFAPIVRQMGALWLDLNVQEFAYYGSENGKMKRLRAHDGVHFSSAGYEQMARALLARLRFD